MQIKPIPRTAYARISGKQIKSLNDLHIAYGLPVKPGENVDLEKVIRWFHDFLSEWGPKIKRKQLANEESAQRADRKEQLELAQLELRLKSLAADLEKKTKNSIPLDEIDKVFSWYESELRRLGERLGKRFGADAQTLFNTNLDRMAKFLDDACGNQPTTD